MNFTNKMVLAKNNLSGYLNSTSLSLKENSSRIINQNFNYSNSIGGYLYLERDKILSGNNIEKGYSLSKNFMISEQLRISQ